jgi:trimeric autotransporter adhesin
MSRPVANRVRISIAALSLAVSGLCLPGLAQSNTPQKSVTGLSSLPTNAQGPISAALGKNDSAYWAHPSAQGFHTENPRHALAAEFTKQGAEILSKVRSHNQRWSLETRAYGYGNVLHPVKAATPQANANRIEYRRDGVTEWYENGPLGLEQGFTLAHRPKKAQGEENNQPLTLELALRGDLVAAVDSAVKSLELRTKDGKAALRYTELEARDATGRALRSWLEVRGERLLVRMDDEGARYPVVVDPWIQQAELTASDGGEYDDFGYSVAVNGNTAVVGATCHPYQPPNCGPGAAYVFVQNAGAWSEQAELAASDGAAGDGFGYSVAVSGSTVVVAARYHAFGSEYDYGSAYVFVESSGTWTQQAELTASDGSTLDFFGSSVAVAGSTIVVGANGNNTYTGAAYIFVQNGTTWTQQAELTASDGVQFNFFGNSVAISGSTVVVGSPFHEASGSNNPGPGAAYVFTQSGETWSEQAEFTASDGVAGDGFGWSVAVDGGTAVAGAGGHTVGSNSGQGAAYVFVQNGLAWNQQAELTASDGQAGDHFGTSVAVSGSSVVVGTNPGTNGQGTAYVFGQNGTAWTQQAELTASDGAVSDDFGWSVGLNGNTALVGAPYHKVGSNLQQGAAYMFEGAPSYTLSASPGNFSIAQGGQGTSTITITPVNGFTGSVSFSASGLPNGVTPTFTPNPATSTSTLTLTASATAATGTATVTVTGTSGSLTATTTLTLTVASASFTLSATPSSVSVAQASQGTSTITVTPANGFSGSVLLSAEGLPYGVTVAFNPNPATSASTLTLAASEAATTGTSAVTVTGSSGGPTETTTLTLTITGIPGTTVTLSPTSLNFGDQPVDTTSATKMVTLKNTGTATLDIGGIAFAQGINFAISKNTCQTTLAAGKTCYVQVTFTPTTVGALSDTLNFTDNATGSPQTVPLSGTGEAQATLSPASYTFANTKVDRTSAAHMFTLKNNLSTTLTGISYATAAPFAVSTSTCGTALDSKASCTISVTFSPTSEETFNGTLTVTDSANDSPQTASLTGTGD